MSAIGTKRTHRVALHMSAFDPKRTSRRHAGMFQNRATNEDFRALAADCGLAYIRTVNAFVSKVMVFDKPPQ